MKRAQAGAGNDSSRKVRAWMGVHHLVYEASTTLGACDLSQKLIWSETKLIPDKTFHGLGTQRKSRTGNELFPTTGREFPSFRNHIIQTKHATSLVEGLSILCDN